MPPLMLMSEADVGDTTVEDDSSHQYISGLF